MNKEEKYKQALLKAVDYLIEYAKRDSALRGRVYPRPYENIKKWISEIDKIIAD